MAKKSAKKSTKKTSVKSSTTNRYETTDGKKFSDRAAATAHQKSLTASGKGAGTSYDVNTSAKTTVKDKAKDTPKDSYEKADDTELRNSVEFKALNTDDQSAVLAVFNAIASNDSAQANRLTSAFKAATKMNDPFFKEQLRIATDAIERGYVSIGDEADFKEKQIKQRLTDIRTDYAAKKDYLSLEQASQMRSIERQYSTDLDTTRQDLAASGKSSSSQRVQKEKLIEDSYGDLRESSGRKFSFDQNAEDQNLSRNERDTQSELSRLSELTKAGKLDFLRKAEQQVGSKALPSLDTSYNPLGNVYGEIPRNKLQDTLSAATSFVF